LFKGEKSYRAYWVLVILTVAYSLVIAFLRPLGVEKGEDAVRISSYAVVGLVIFGVLFLMVYIRNHLRKPPTLYVDNEQVLPDKLKMVGGRVGTGRAPKVTPSVEKRDRWEDGTCKGVYVEELCMSCVHHRRRYYGNFCKHFGYVVDRPTQAG